MEPAAPVPVWRVGPESFVGYGMGSIRERDAMGVHVPDDEAGVLERDKISGSKQLH